MERKGPQVTHGEKVREMKTRRMTMAQALIQFLKNQYVERDGQQHAFFAGMLGIFGHGNVAGIGQALQQNPDFKYIMVRNEQSGVHLAAAFAKASNRLRAFACTSSIGPGATNMITGAALATINRLPPPPPTCPPPPRAPPPPPSLRCSPPAPPPPAVTWRPCCSRSNRQAHR